MRRPATILGVLLLVACGDDGGATLPTGTFRLVAESLNGTATPGDRLHGALQLTDTDIAMGVATSQLTGALGAYTATGNSLAVSGGPTFTAGTAGDRLMLTQGTSSWTFEPFTPTRTETLPVTGTVTLGSGITLMNPRIAVVFLSLTMPYVNSPRDDRELTFSGSTATFDLSRDDGPLGIEVIEWGANRQVVTSIGYVLVYEDRNASLNLDELAACGTSTVDCIRAVSPVIVAYRNGDSPELAGSQYGTLRPGWSQAVPVQDRRVNELGLVSSAESAYRHDLTIAGTSAVNIPAFDLTMP